MMSCCLQLRLWKQKIVQKSISESFLHSNYFSAHTIFKNNSSPSIHDIKVLWRCLPTCGNSPARLLLPVVDFDSFGKPGDGILQGRTKFLGMYDECINVTFSKKSATGESKVLSTKYCAVTIPFRVCIYYHASLSIINTSIPLCMISEFPDTLSL